MSTTTSQHTSFNAYKIYDNIEEMLRSRTCDEKIVSVFKKVRDVMEEESDIGNLEGEIYVKLRMQKTVEELRSDRKGFETEHWILKTVLHELDTKWTEYFLKVELESLQGKFARICDRSVSQETRVVLHQDIEKHLVKLADRIHEYRHKDPWGWVLNHRVADVVDFCKLENDEEVISWKRKLIEAWARMEAADCLIVQWYAMLGTIRGIDICEVITNETIHR